MGRLIYLLNMSADGFVETPEHSLDWSSMDEELHAWFNEQMRGLDATIYGRGLYETMAAYWPTAEEDPSITDVEREFAQVWNALPKIVFSSTLESVDWNSRLVRDGDVGEELERLRTEFDGDIGVAGATLAASFIRRGLVDEFRLVVHPVAIGGGTPYFPSLDTPIRLRFIESRAFRLGVHYLRYAVDR